MAGDKFSMPIDRGTISRRWLLASLVLAAIAWALFIAVQLLRPGQPLLWILTAGWPVYYAVVLGFVYGMSWVVKQGGPSGGWLPLLPSSSPAWLKKFIDRPYVAAMYVGLIAFPSVAIAIGAASLYALKHG